MSINVKHLKGPKGYPLVGMTPKLDLNNLHNQLEGWAKEFGDVFNLDLGYTSQTVVSRPSIIHKIFANRPEGFIRMKKMDGILKEGGVHGVFNAEGDEWRLHRKIVAKGLDVKHQKEFYPLMLSTVEKLYNKWAKNAENGDVFDIQRDLLRFTVDITATLAFGFKMNTLEQEGSAIQDHMEKVFPMIFKRINQPIQWHRLYKNRADKEFEVAVEEMKKLVEEFISSGIERLKSNPELKDNPSNLLESILIAAEEEKDFTLKEVRGTLLTLLMAGEDTTAHTLIWILYLLTMHTDVQKGIREEVDRILGEDKWLKEYKANNEFHFIEGVAHESMRFKPVAPIMVFQAAKEMNIEEFCFKKGQKIITNYRPGALNDDYFTDAQNFNPKRWLKESKCPVHNMEAFAAFGGGPRYCPGRNLAILEIKMVIAMLFKNFNVEMVTEHKDIHEIMAFAMMASDYKVRLTPRG